MDITSLREIYRNTEHNTRKVYTYSLPSDFNLIIATCYYMSNLQEGGVTLKLSSDTATTSYCNAYGFSGESAITLIATNCKAGDTISSECMRLYIFGK